MHSHNPSRVDDLHALSNLYQLSGHLQLALMRRSKIVKICECGPFQWIGMEMVHLLLHSCLQTYSNNEKVRQLCAKSNACFSRSAPFDDAVTNLTQHRAACPPTVSLILKVLTEPKCLVWLRLIVLRWKSQWAAFTVTSQFNESQQWLLWMIVYTPWMKIISIKCIKSRWDVFKHFPFK